MFLCNPIVERHFRTSWLFEDLAKCSGFGSTILKQPLKCHRSMSWVLCPASHSSRHIPLTLSLQYVPNRLRMSLLLTVQGKSKVNLEEKEGARQEECSFSDLWVIPKQEVSLSFYSPVGNSGAKGCVAFRFVFCRLLCSFNLRKRFHSLILVWVSESKHRLVDLTLSGEEVKSVCT